MNYESQIKLLTALLAASPESSELRWERATTFERWGNALLKRDDVDAALEKYRACVEEKAEILANGRSEAAEDAERRLWLAKNYLGIATLERQRGRVDEARDRCEAAIRTLEEGGEVEPSSERNEILQNARSILTALDQRR